VGAGVDVVTDFSVAQGDKVQLDAGTSFTVVQQGANTVVELLNGGVATGDELILQNVQMSSLPAGTVFLL
jgi:ferric-dicitrate binding protein FerR (iron transport regulator)